MQSASFTLELCCADIHSVQTAECYAVPAIELCTDLSCGGLSPSLGLIRQSRKLFSGEMGVLIRPRKGNFCYTPLEQEVMLDELAAARDEGADFLVLGCLLKDGDLDRTFMERLIERSNGIPLTFHRAFDFSPQPELLLDRLMDMQIDRILSGGGCSRAVDGIENLNTWRAISGKRMEWVAAGSIDHTQVQQIVSSTGIRRIHCALRRKTKQAVQPIQLGSPDEIDNASLKAMLDVKF
ncbi:MAG: hypothetical protein KBF37_07600 [Saprospiraceae bacterium]|jgi:copper homeostasis protein|nr:hypothetical protein [Saprospiraceae bacterium]MBP9210168.1 hypothetical protein [Saprospiraceae bacterium]MBV6473485.1 Copper homeostasis protein CutC [Saprospiraceae bacterium]